MTLAPGARRVSYDSDESGQREVYVRGFAPDRNPATRVGQWQISPAGGSRPRWSHDGREFVARDLDLAETARTRLRQENRILREEPCRFTSTRS
jgi:hypothetical protein